MFNAFCNVTVLAMPAGDVVGVIDVIVVWVVVNLQDWSGLRDNIFVCVRSIDGHLGRVNLGFIRVV